MCYQLCGVASFSIIGWCKQMGLVVKAAPQERRVGREANFTLILNFTCCMSLLGEKERKRSTSELPFLICFSKLILALKSPYGNHFFRKEWAQCIVSVPWKKEVLCCSSNSYLSKIPFIFATNKQTKKKKEQPSEKQKCYFLQENTRNCDNAVRYLVYLCSYCILKVLHFY